MNRQQVVCSLGASLITSLFLSGLTATASDAQPRVSLQLIVSGLTSPSILIPITDGSKDMLLGEQTGVLHVMDRNGKLRESLFGDLRPRMATLNKGFDERGLLGVALHPKFKQNRKIYISYSAPKRESSPPDWDCTSRLSEFKVTGKDALQLDMGSERVVLEIDKPYFNHNGGRIDFGPDGFLYIGVGDGGNKNDTGKRSPKGNGQDISVLLGKILRIDVDHGTPYGIPKDNPFAHGPGKPEIFAYGIRNPWGLSFDKGGKHELFASEVGQSVWEEVNIIAKGGNYGWNAREGTGWFDPKTELVPAKTGPLVDDFGKPFIDPVIQYKNIAGWPKDPEATGKSVTGGYVYRGKALKELQGKYVFADWSRHFALPQGVLLTATRPANSSIKQWKVERLIPASHPGENIGEFICACGQDRDGEIYFLTNGSNTVTGKTGKVFKLVRAE